MTDQEKQIIDEQRQILEAVSKFKVEIDAEFASVRESFLAMVENLNGVTGICDQLSSRTATAEASIGISDASISSIAAAVQIQEKRLDEFTGRVASLESLTYAGGMALDALQSRLDSLQETLWAEIQAEIGLRVQREVEAYVAARKARKTANLATE